MSESLIAIYTRLAGEGRLSADQAQEALLPRLEVLRDALEDPPGTGGLRGLFARKPPPPRGIYIWGGVGRGKSMLMDLFFASVGIEDKRRVHFHAFMQEVQAGLERARKTGVPDALVPVADDISRDLRLLCFDEMQITDIADAMIVGRLFEKMIDAGVSIVATSNRPPDDLYKGGWNRDQFLPFIALLKERLDIWELRADQDYRQDRLEGEQSYFYPADAAARNAVNAIWKSFGGGPDSPGLTLRIKGHDVHLPGFVNGVARAEFYDLCTKPLGPADFLAIAEAARVLILENIPRLSSENYNEARRFVTLIDALYEAKVRLVATAADKPENLYIEGEGTFEFERTASRLREMQSAGWPP